MSVVSSSGWSQVGRGAWSECIVGASQGWVSDIRQSVTAQSSLPLVYNSLYYQYVCPSVCLSVCFSGCPSFYHSTFSYL